MADVKETCDDNKMDVQNSSGSKDLSKSLPVEAFNNFLQGRRHMLVHDYHNAVVNLTKACEMYVNHFGEIAIECAEVYFLYGKALFRLAQEQNGILGNALNDGSNEDNSSESEGKENESEKNSGDEEEGEENEAEVSEQENKEEKEPSESTDSPPATVDEGSSEAKVEDNSEAKAETSKSTETAETSDKETKEKDKNEPEVPETAGESKAEESMDENNEAEEDDMELAWNNLETAKTIFMRRDTVESQLKIAEIFQLLAEISMESDNNAAAISDLKKSLEIQKKYLKPDDRMLAETYYQMGLALMLDKAYHDALENFLTTKKILQLHIENLKNTPVDDADGTFASADIAVEVADIENVILDLNLKIDDTEELISNQKKELEELLKEPGFSSPLKEKDEKTTTNKAVTNITHLLKRKKPDEGTSEDAPKRIKLTSVLNGDSKVTAPANTEG